MTAPVELVRELLYYRDMSSLNRRDWGLITAFIAGGSLALPVLAPVAIGSIVALGLHKLRGMYRKRVIEGVMVAPAAAGPGAVTVYGTARRFRSTVSSLLDRPSVLIEHAAIKDRRGAVLLRRSEGTPFLLEREGEESVLVTGIARVTTANLIAERMHVRGGDPRLERMGVPSDLAIAGELEIASVVADGPHLAVTGVIEDEAVAELAFHRDGGRIPVMRGRIGAPVLIHDRRLLAAAL